MAVSARSLSAALAAIAGPDAVIDDPVRTAGASLDGVVPHAIVRPSSVVQVGQVLALAQAERLAVVPRGRGRSLDAGHPVPRVDVILDLSGLDRVLDWNPDDLTVSVEAGITLGALNETVLAPKRQALVVDPPGWRRRSAGGVAATGASGPLRARYGTMRDLLLGVRFVQADGVVTWGGAKVVKSVTGYDVPKLMVGAHGTLGVLTELTLRLHPAPETERGWFVTVPSFEALQACLDAVVDSPLSPNRVEVLDTGALAGFGVGDAKAALAVSFGSAAEAVREQGERLVELTRRAGGAATERSMDLWRDVEQVATAGPGDVTLELATLPGEVGATLRALTAATLASGTACALTGCATVGGLRAIVHAATVPVVAALVSRLREVVAPAGGSVVVRGPYPIRASVDPWGPVDPMAFALMQRLKDEFDPRRVLNPGRFVGGL